MVGVSSISVSVVDAEFIFGVILRYVCISSEALFGTLVADLKEGDI